MTDSTPATAAMCRWCGARDGEPHDTAAHDACRWWVATGRKQDNGRRVLGPFDSRELALEVRTLAETAWDREGAFWVVTGDEIPERTITPGFFRKGTR